MKKLALLTHRSVILQLNRDVLSSLLLNLLIIFQVSFIWVFEKKMNFICLNQLITARKKDHINSKL